MPADWLSVVVPGQGAGLCFLPPPPLALARTGGEKVHRLRLAHPHLLSPKAETRRKRDMCDTVKMSNSDPSSTEPGVLWSPLREPQGVVAILDGEGTPWKGTALAPKACAGLQI